MRLILCILPLALCSCGSLEMPDGTKLNHGLQDVAFEKAPDGTVRYVSTVSPVAGELIRETASTGRAWIQGWTLLGLGEQTLEATINKQDWDGQIGLKGTKDPNVIPHDPNVIPVNPNQ